MYGSRHMSALMRLTMPQVVVTCKDAPPVSLKVPGSQPQSFTRKAKRKKCVSCGSLKELEEFGKHDSSQDGRTSHCNTCRAGQNKRHRARDPNHYLKHHMATRISTQIPNAPPTLTADLEKYLGYSIVSLRSHLDTDVRAREGITLKDAIKLGYHLDHIKPLSRFKVSHIRSLAFRECWAIDNLRMISAQENLAKGARWDG